MFLAGKKGPSQTRRIRDRIRPSKEERGGQERRRAGSRSGPTASRAIGVKSTLACLRPLPIREGQDSRSKNLLSRFP